MQKDEPCKVLCETDAIPVEDAKFINKAVSDGYAFNWLVDGLPAATEDVDIHTNEKYYNIGFKMGSATANTPYLNNHYGITIYYHVTPKGLSRVVGVVVDPSSRETKSTTKGEKQCTESVEKFHLAEDGKTNVIYTYSVKWIVKYHSPSIISLETHFFFLMCK